MKKKKKKLDSYAIGTSKNGVTKIYNETPAEALAENDIAKAKAKYESESNGLTMALDMIGNMGVQYGTSMMGQYGGAAAGALQGGNQLASMENGGTAGNIPVEVEGDEVAETPDGQVSEFKGPSHKQGGIEVALPEGTKIFSEKLKVKGKSLAKRKLARERKMETLMKKLDNNPSDKILKQTIERTQQVHAQEETADFQLQEFASILDGLQSFAYGTSQKGLKKMANGGPVRPYFSKGYDNTMYNDFLSNYMKSNPDFNISDKGQRKALQTELGVTPDGIFGKNTLGALKKSYPMQGIETPKPKGLVDPSTGYELDDPINREAFDNLSFDTDEASLFGATEAKVGIPGLETGEIPDLATPGIVPEGEARMGEEGAEAGRFPFTAGDITGMLGTAISTIGPYLQTLKNRAEDTPNVNSFKDFGNDALDVNEESQDYVASQRDNAMNRILSNRNATVKRNRNTARGVNTMRALDLTADQNVNRAMADVYDNFSSQMMNILGDKAQLENQQDSMVMQGEAGRDLADRQDKDNYDTQLAQNMANIGAGVQKIGSDVNQAKGNKDFMDILPDLSQYGLGYVYDENGNLVIEKVK